MKNLQDFYDPVLDERNGRKPIYINKHLAKDFILFCAEVDKKPHKVAEYLISLGINSIKHNTDKKVQFDIKAL